MQIYFLTLEDVLTIHADQINRYGGRRGVRDQNLLLSAIAQPLSTFDGQYLHKTFYDKAAAYFFHISQNHPFIDGNKRVALVSTLMFLVMNDHAIDYDENELEQLTYAVAKGKASKEEIARFLEKGLS
jgi:death on curing protein